MKIRIKGNAIRLRLTRSEVQAVATEGYLADETAFRVARFTYALKADPNLDQLNADFKDGTITLYMPTSFAQEWYNTEKVGFEHHLKFHSGELLHLLIEKDFMCMDESTEDQSDNYPNPSATEKNETC